MSLNYTIYEQNFNHNLDYMRTSEIAVVVRDCDKANDLLCAMLGFEKQEPHTGVLENVIYRGRVINTTTRRIDYQIGSLCVKIMEPVDSEGIFDEFLKEHGPGIEHICIKVKDVDEVGERFIKAGHEAIQEQTWAFGRGVFYDFRDMFGCDIELVEVFEKEYQAFKESAE